MFSKQKAWEPKTKPPAATVKVVAVKSSRPRTPATAPSHNPSRVPSTTQKRKRAGSTDSPAPSSSSSVVYASRQQQRTHLSVPSSPRKRKVSPSDSDTSRMMTADADSEESEEEPDALFEGLNKRLNKPKASRARQDPARDLPSKALKELDKNGYVSTGPAPRFVHACDLVSLSRDAVDEDGKKTGKKVKQQAKKLFPQATDEESTVELQYPASLTKERYVLIRNSAFRDIALTWANRFDLVDEKDKIDVIKDIIKVVKHVRDFYVTGEEDTRKFDSPDGIMKRLKRGAGLSSINGVNKPDIAVFRKAINDYNDIVLRRLKSGATLKVIQKQHMLPDDLVEHIMTQMYDRIITPVVDHLKQYKNGTSEVYGELRNHFVTKVLCSDLKMSSEQTFVDLGSGVGNVVLQAALQIGCESWGCEYMNNPASFAKRQHKEFVARCQLWGIQPGPVRLIQGDFQSSKECPGLYEALRRADVVLTNNKAFVPELNAQLMLIFLELKSGCQIVSLTNFSAASRHNTNDVANALSPEADEHTWPTKSVSWSDEPGLYYITKRL